VRVGLISDIHCNLRGLERALDLLQDCDEVLCAGDLLYQYRFSNDVLALLRRRTVRAILGNHDKTILYTPSHPLRSSPSVGLRGLEYLASLPSHLALTLGGTRIAMFHGSPWDEVKGPIAHYIFPADRQSLERLAEVPADLIILGHTHVPMEVWVDGRLVVNPGSCGEARDESRMLSCAMLDLETGRRELRRFAVDEA